MKFPNRKEIQRIQRKLRKVESTRLLPADSSGSDRLKYDLCQIFVHHLLTHKTSQRKLAHELEIDPARMNEIVKYRIDLFTVDRLLDYVERLIPKLKVSVY